jgi:hypothetical protein
MKIIGQMMKLAPMKKQGKIACDGRSLITRIAIRPQPRAVGSEIIDDSGV